MFSIMVALSYFHFQFMSVLSVKEFPLQFGTLKFTL